MKFIFSIVVAVAICANINGQSLTPTVYSTSGSTFENANFSLSYTIGEAITATVSTNNNILTQGFQQPVYEVVSDVTNYANSLSININVFPNPTDKLVHVEFNAPENKKAVMYLYDISGKVISTETLQANTVQTINLENAATGQYHLKIIDVSNQLLSTHKIQKIN
jgi:hypothetical protein